MKISRNNTDDLNAIIKIDIEKKDYDQNVMSILKDYRKKVNIPGFRKGHIPMDLVKKKYERFIKIDEVNKLLKDFLNAYLVREKVNFFGNPIMRNFVESDWDNDDFSFEFELGLVPEMQVNLTRLKVKRYDIIVDDNLIDKEISHLQNHFGSKVVQEAVSEESMISGVFTDEDSNIKSNADFMIQDIDSRKNLDKFLNAKVGDILVLNLRDLFKKKKKLAELFHLKEDQCNSLPSSLNFEIMRIIIHEPSDLNQDFFDKIFEKKSIKSTDEFRIKMRESIQTRFEKQSDQHLLDSIIENLIANTPFDLPKDFLMKWWTTLEGKFLTKEESTKEFEKSEKGLRYKLIVQKIITDNGIKIDFQEIKDYAIDLIKNQMGQFRDGNLEDGVLENIANRILKNKEEVKRIEDQIMNSKILALFKEIIPFKEKRVSYDSFIKKHYKKTD